MNDPYYEMLINEYKEFLSMVEDIGPLLKGNKELTSSWGKYTKLFCLDLIANVDYGKSEHLDFVNNIVFPGDSEITLNEYKRVFRENDCTSFDKALMKEQVIVQGIKRIDEQRGTDYYERFISHYCMLADIFSDQSATFRQPVEQFIKKYKEGFDDSDERILEAKIQELTLVPEEDNPPDRNATYAASENNAYPYTKIPEKDGQYKARVQIPLYLWVSLTILGIVLKSFGMILLAIIALIVWIFGLKAQKQRCPQCRAWGSLMTVKSEKVGQQRVKVRRNLNSAYFRTSGNNTFATRQVFVSADEYTYKEVYRCSHCGYEIRGTRTAVDDGIR